MIVNEKEVKSLRAFKAWGAGAATKRAALRYRKAADVWAILEESFPEGATEEEVNSSLACDVDIISLVRDIEINY